MVGPRGGESGERIIEKVGQGEILPIFNVWNEVRKGPPGHKIHGVERVRGWSGPKIIGTRTEKGTRIKEGEEDRAEARENLKRQLRDLDSSSSFAIRSRWRRTTWVGRPGDSVSDLKPETGDNPEGLWKLPRRETLSEERSNRFTVNHSNFVGAKSSSELRTGEVHRGDLPFELREKLRGVENILEDNSGITGRWEVCE